MEYAQKESLIKGLHNALSQGLPDGVPEKDYYFDEGTGTYYLLTGRKQIDLPSAEGAKKFFEEIIAAYTSSDTKEDMTKAVYCSIAVEAIDKMIRGANK